MCWCKLQRTRTVQQKNSLVFNLTKVVWNVISNPVTLNDREPQRMLRQKVKSWVVWSRSSRNCWKMQEKVQFTKHPDHASDFGSALCEVVSFKLSIMAHLSLQPIRPLKRICRWWIVLQTRQWQSWRRGSKAWKKNWTMPMNCSQVLS